MTETLGLKVPDVFIKRLLIRWCNGIQTQHTATFDSSSCLTFWQGRGSFFQWLPETNSEFTPENEGSPYAPNLETHHLQGICMDMLVLGSASEHASHQLLTSSNSIHCDWWPKKVDGWLNREGSQKRVEPLSLKWQVSSIKYRKASAFEMIWSFCSNHTMTI